MRISARLGSRPAQLDSARKCEEVLQDGLGECFEVVYVLLCWLIDLVCALVSKQPDMMSPVLHCGRQRIPISEGVDAGVHLSADCRIKDLQCYIQCLTIAHRREIMLLPAVTIARLLEDTRHGIRHVIGGSRTLRLWEDLRQVQAKISHDVAALASDKPAHDQFAAGTRRQNSGDRQCARRTDSNYYPVSSARLSSVNDIHGDLFGHAMRTLYNEDTTHD